MMEHSFTTNSAFKVITFIKMDGGNSLLPTRIGSCSDPCAVAVNGATPRDMYRLEYFKVCSSFYKIVM